MRVLVVLGNERRGAAEVVLGRKPEEVKNQAVLLVWGESQPPTNRLSVETSHLGGPQHHHAVNVRAIVALKKQRCVGEYRALASLGEPFQLLLAVW